MKRDGSTRQDASSRLNSQFPIADKLPYADHVVENSGNLLELEAATQSLIDKLNRESGGLMWLLCWLIPPIGIFCGLKSVASKSLQRGRRAYKKRGRS